MQYTATASGGAQLLLNGQTQAAWGVSGDFTRSTNLQKLQLWDDATDRATSTTCRSRRRRPRRPRRRADRRRRRRRRRLGRALVDGAGLDGGSPITSYRITPYIGATAQTAIVTGTTATTRTVTGLTNGTAYTFTVAAINGVGTGADSAASAAITPTAAATAPGAPTGVGGHRR